MSGIPSQVDACSQHHPPFEWLELSITIDPVVHDVLSSFLFDMGCTGIATQGETDECLKAYLPFSDNLEEIRERIARFLKTLQDIFSFDLSPTFSFSKIADQAWHVAWRRFFRPITVTPNLMILPEWEQMPNDASGHVIRMDPGPAFGTGYHETTRLCLKAMEQLTGNRPWTMLDVGTGSGILALYAALLGAGRILAVDIDAEALRWAKRNARLNGLSKAIELASTPVEVVNARFSIVCANLILGEIERLFASLLSHTEPGGWLILSGILRDQVGSVSFLADKTHTQCRDISYEGEWACVMIHKPGEKA
ncbi:MAG: 50S ribosomal protein L11 methyltransferase [Deltaproteobacteria bacterium]|nr:50S ribosomal protein L11 methyltransferase [Deltaproteobacteria bacterium]